MTLEEVRNEIDEIDTNMKPLFLRRMKCGRTDRRRCICSRKRT